MGDTLIENIKILNALSPKQKLFDQNDIFPDEENKNLLKTLWRKLGKVY